VNQRTSKPWYVRPMFGLVGLGFVSLGLRPLLKGGLFYQTYWGGAAFAPVVVLLGLFFLCLAALAWSWLERRDTDVADKRDSRSKGR
jgi:hypothetical protein